MNKVLPHQRQKAVLKLLADNGPLSMRGLSACLYPPIIRKRLFEVVRRLKNRKLLIKRHYKTLGLGGIYYQISQDPKGLDVVAGILSTRPSNLLQPHYRRIELFHSETCVVWKELLKHLFPEVRVLREHEFSGDAIVSKLLNIKNEDRELRPDLVLIAKSQVTQENVCVAIEIEKSPKSEKRLIRKLHKYSTQTRLDGIIYVCEETALSERLRHIYKSRILEQALRIKHYGNHFFLLSDGSLNVNRTEPAMFNAALEPVSIQNWLHNLTHTQNRARRDVKFESRGL